MRNDTYAIYNRKEYRIFLSEGMAELISNDVKDLSNGFKEYRPERNHTIPILTKTVSPSEIEEVYEISTYALYQGYEFWIKWASENEYLLNGNNNLTLMDKLNFKRVDKYGYEKLVKKDEVDLVYEKKTDYRLLRLNLRPSERDFSDGLFITGDNHYEKYNLFVSFSHTVQSLNFIYG